MELINLATLFRIINLYTHHAHNLTKGQSFLEDHDFFGSLYEMADTCYDDLIERYIGTVGDNVDLKNIVAESYKVISKLDNDFFPNTLVLFKNALSRLDSLCKSPSLSEGTKNLLQGKADEIEVIIYKLKRKTV